MHISNTRRTALMVIGLILLLVAGFCSLILGYTPMTPATLVGAISHFDPSNTDHLILRTERLSRTLISLCVGASLAVSGALMQTLTRNALASPGILGINAGAMFFLVAASTLFSLNAPALLVWSAFLGAAVAALAVVLLGGGRKGLSPSRMVLAGVAISALFVSFAQGLLIVNQERLESILFWLGGSVSGRGTETLLPLLPFFLVSALVCVVLARQLNLLALSDELAAGLGQRILMIKILAAATVIVLAGASVSIAGLIGFIGLIVPHMTRALLGPDHRWLLPGCALLGATLLMTADVVSRLVIAPQEIPVGVMTALLGTPFFFYLARKRSYAQ